MNHNDSNGIFGNRYISRGLTPEGIAWAFDPGSVKELSYWQPLSMVFQMASFSLVGNNPVRHHMINIGLQLLNAWILFVLFREMTGRDWRSFFLAAIFAIHPLHIESVAWIPTRTDLVSGFFFFLAMWAHARHARNPSAKRVFLVTVLGAMAMMSKPSTVVLPVLLLLLDGWPLGRFGVARTEREGDGGTGRFSRQRELLLEKWPLFALAAAFSLFTMAGRHETGYLDSAVFYPFWSRVVTVPYNYALCVRDFLVPLWLQFCPMTPCGMFPWWEGLLAALFVSTITVATYVGRKRNPALATGWLWFLIALFPVTGIVPSHADGVANRHLYLPITGLAIMAVWGSGDLLSRFRVSRAGRLSAGSAVLLLLLAVSSKQLGYWRSTDTLFQRTRELAYPELNSGDASTFARASCDLGDELYLAGRPDEALIHFRNAIRAAPSDPRGWNEIGIIHLERGNAEEAVLCFLEVIRLDPGIAEAHANLALSFECLGNYGEAERHYAESLRIRPGDQRVKERLEGLRRLSTPPPSSR